MKKFLHKLSILYLLVNIVQTTNAFEVNGIEYEEISTNSGTVEVTGPTDNFQGGNIDIPVYVTEVQDGEILGTYKVVGIGENAFSSCSSLVSINIPESVTYIGGGAFHDCTNLTSINIPDGVTYISGSTFSGCTELTSINIPDGVTSIGNYAFQFTAISTINLPKNIVTIETGTFSSCHKLISITKVSHHQKGGIK